MSTAIDALDRTNKVPRPKRIYSDADRANTLIALELNDGNLSKTERETGIPIATIAEWRNGRINENVTNIQHLEKQSLADRFENLAHLYISQAVTTVEHSKGTQAIVGAATATDKMRLLRGESTINIEQNNDRIATALSKLIQGKRDNAQRNNEPFPSDDQLLQLIETACKANGADVETVKSRLLNPDNGESTT